MASKNWLVTTARVSIHSGASAVPTSPQLTVEPKLRRAKGRTG